MISVKRELLQAIITQFSHHLSENAIFRHFWPFCPICACSWVTPQSHLRFYWQKCYHWVLLQWYLWKESYSRLLQPHFPTICLKIEFLVKSRSWRGGWWTVWSQTPPITLKLGRCAQGHNWVRIVSECRDILMLWYFQPPLLTRYHSQTLKPHNERLVAFLNSNMLISLKFTWFTENSYTIDRYHCNSTHW